MSELIRVAVRKEIRGENDSKESKKGTDTGGIEVDRIQEQQQTIISKIQELSENVENSQQEREAEAYPEEVKSAAFSIASDLETISPDKYANWTSDENIALTKLAAENFDDGEATHKITAALNYLEENVDWIRKKPALPNDYYRVRE